MNVFSKTAVSWARECLAAANPIRILRKKIARQNLGYAVNRNWPDVVHKYCDILGKDAAAAAHENGAPWITLAAARGHFECLEILLRSGANPDSVESDGASALMLAAEFGNFRCVDALIAGGADVNALNFAGQSALARVALRLIRSPGGPEVDYSRCIQRLIASGSDINHRHAGATLLRLSSGSGATDLAIALLEAGAVFDPSSSSPPATAAYHHAMSSGQWDCARGIEQYHQIFVDKAAMETVSSPGSQASRSRVRL